MNALTDNVSTNAPDSGLILDGRPIGDLLEFFRRYCAAIPFGDAQSGDWAQFFFQNGVTPESMATLFDDADSANGLLAPQQAFVLAFMRMLETPRSLLNRLPAMHRDLYYREFLGLSPRAAQADKVVVALSVDPSVDEALVPAGTLFDGGQDAAGNALQYALDSQLLANHARWTDLRWTMPSTDGSGATLARTVFDEAAGEPWPAAGARLFDANASAPPAARGLLIGSPLLAMSGGTRSITLRFADEIDPSQFSEAFISGAQQWLPLTLWEPGKVVDPDGNPITLITCTLSAEAGATGAPEGGDALDGFSADMPCVKLLYTGNGAPPEVIGIDVSVAGLPDVAYATDDGADKTGARSYPFGNNAVVGSSFTLAATDWYGKPGIPLTITVEPEWIDLPADGFPQWYDGYPKPADNAEFTVQTWLVGAGGKEPAGSGTQPLFNAGTDAPQGAMLAVGNVSGFAGQPSDSVDPRDWPRWLRFELAPKDFLAREYQQQIASHPELNEPYRPQVASVKVGWSASAPPVRRWQLTPFGYTEADDAVSDDGPVLYLGFTGVRPGQDLSLYWNLRSPQALQLSWQCLNSDNQWTSLDALVNDSTGALFDSGQWRVALPHDATDDTSRMPSGRVWIRAAISAGTDKDANTNAAIGYPWLYGLLTNAASATLQNVADIDASHFEAALPAGTITRTVEALDGITEVEQPWPSFGARPAETDDAFNQRIAQRLLHRDRALTWNDIAMLLKEGFPEVMSVQLPSIAQLSILPPPRQQIVVVVPANGSADNDDPLRPGFGAARLAQMQAYLQSRASLWMEIVVRNPKYREVVIDYEIEFTPATNPDYGYRLLKEELAERYMPWSLAGDAGAVLGNQIDYYGMVAWIQQRPYVKRVVSLTIDGANGSVQGDDAEVLILTLPDKTRAPTLQGTPS